MLSVLDGSEPKIWSWWMVLGWMVWLSKMERGILKLFRLYYQQLFIECLFHCRHMFYSPS